MSAVYVIANVVSKKLYVGKANDVERRWRDHRRDAKRDSPRSVIGAAIKKHRIGSFRFDIVETCATEEDAFWWESWWIQYLGSSNPGAGYNLDGGGVGGKSVSESTRRRISTAGLGRRPTPATKVKLSAWQTGRTLTAEHRAKISASRKLPEVRARIVAAASRRKHSAETRAKMSASHQRASP